jgi:molybdopterin-dependent oxidoreductase alpha subunit
VAWQNRDEAGYAWRILKDGVCDGCALGTTGMRDHTLGGTHLCNVRLELLRLNTMGALPPEVIEALGDLAASGLLDRTGAELRELGRLPYPMIRRRGEPGFRRVGWGEAEALLGDRMGAAAPERISFYLTSRGITNEIYYVAQKVARFLGTNHVDNSARVCHAPSTTGLSRALGVAASTCSYIDWIGTDLLILIGTDLPNNQPVATKYMYYAKAKGTRVLTVNPFREPGLDRYWIPSVADSALFGTKLTDDWFHPRQGGDAAFLNGVLKALIARGGVDEAFVRDHTSGFDGVRAFLEAEPWERLVRLSGVERDEMEAFARRYHEAESAVFVWSMGITQHRFGADNVHAIVNLALARGNVGRNRAGLMPIRGHSGVQGGAEVGAVPWKLPGGVPVGADGSARFQELWGFPVPASRGLSAVETVDAAHRGEIDVLWSIGGDHLATLPDPAYCREALERVPLRVHQDIVLTHPMLVDPADVVVLLPATTRYEMPGGGTETTTERRIYFNPEIPGRRIGEARPEWEVLVEVAARARPEAAHRIRFADTAAVRAEIARAVPFYDGIQHLKEKGDQIQWGGRHLCEGGRFPTDDGRARFRTVRPPEPDLPEGWFHMSTRRGKQFNSMVQAKRDPLTGADREAVFVSRQDAAGLGLSEGDPVVVRNEQGEVRGRARLSRLRPGSLQLHWPEGYALVPRGVVEPESGIPDFNAAVELIPLRRETGGRGSGGHGSGAGGEG